MSGSIASKSRRELGFYFDRQQKYDVREIVATVVYKATAADTSDPEEHGRSLNPPADRHGHPAAAYADFHVRAYLEREGRCHSARYVFKPFEMDTARAEACVRVLRSVDRATHAMQDADGYLPGHDFTGHLLRVARAIGADYFDWRPRPRGPIERTDAKGIGEVVTALLGATAIGG
jgi:hypothetical protein